MRDQLIHASCTEDGEPSSAPEDIPVEQRSSVSLHSNQPCSELSLPILASHCLREVDTYRRGEPSTNTYGLELLRRATIQGNHECWTWVQQCFGEMVRGWLRCHPQREVACRLESEENYVAQAFERFWLATAINQRVEFSTLAATLQYLRASLYGIMLDILRANARPREISLPEPGASLVEESSDHSDRGKPSSKKPFSQSVQSNVHEQYQWFVHRTRSQAIIAEVPGVAGMASNIVRKASSIFLRW